MRSSSRSPVDLISANQGNLSSSVRGIPCDILSTLDCGCNESPSRNGTLSASERLLPIVDFPLKEAGHTSVKLYKQTSDSIESVSPGCWSLWISSVCVPHNRPRATTHHNDDQDRPGFSRGHSELYVILRELLNGRSVDHGG